MAGRGILSFSAEVMLVDVVQRRAFERECDSRWQLTFQRKLAGHMQSSLGFTQLQVVTMRTSVFENLCTVSVLFSLCVYHSDTLWTKDKFVMFRRERLHHMPCRIDTSNLQLTMHTNPSSIYGPQINPNLAYVNISVQGGTIRDTASIKVLQNYNKTDFDCRRPYST